MYPVRRDENGYAHIVAVSGGKDSTAMALELRTRHPDVPFTYVCTPTGDELPEMFEHWRKLGDMLGGKILPVMADTLKGCCEKQKMLPNSRARFCTRILKIAPFKKFLLCAIPAYSYVGLRADEEGREGANYGGDALLSSPDGVIQRYPLREWGWGIMEVLACCERHGVEIPERTDCARCFFQKLGEWWNLWKNYPEIYADAEAQELAFGHTFRSPSRDTWPASLRDLRLEFEQGRVPERSLRMMESRKGMCRTCTL